jgi:hypothetical protein
VVPTRAVNPNKPTGRIHQQKSINHTRFSIKISKGQRFPAYHPMVMHDGDVFKLSLHRLFCKCFAVRGFVINNMDLTRYVPRSSVESMQSCCYSSHRCHRRWSSGGVLGLEYQRPCGSLLIPAGYVRVKEIRNIWCIFNVIHDTIWIR